MCRTCDSQPREAQQNRDMTQGHPTGMAPMSVPPTLGNQDAPTTPITVQPDAAAATSITRGSLAPWAGRGPGGACPP